MGPVLDQCLRTDGKRAHQRHRYLFDGRFLQRAEYKKYAMWGDVRVCVLRTFEGSERLLFCG